MAVASATYKASARYDFIRTLWRMSLLSESTYVSFVTQNYYKGIDWKA